MRFVAPPVPRARTGFSALVMVLGAAFLIVLWAASAHFVSATVRRRVHIARAQRRCLEQAEAASEEAFQFLWIEANEELEGADLGDASLAARVRALAPGERLEVGYRPVGRLDDDPHVPLAVDEVAITLYPLDLEEGQGEVEEDFCEKLGEWVEKWSAIPG